MRAEVACRLCGRSSPLWFEAAGRAVHRCPECRHIEVPAGLARVADGRSIYETQDAVFTADGNADYYFDETSALAARDKVAWVRRFAPGPVLVDVGASYGQFLAAASLHFDAVGFEVSPDAVAYSQRVFGVRNVVGSIYDWPAGIPAAADVVTCWDVIEHLEDPLGAAAVLASHLRPGGWLFLSTPDAGSLVARGMGRRWHYVDPLQHINLFSSKNLTRLLARAGLDVKGRRVFGRRYRVRYVWNRLRYLYGRSPAGLAINAAAFATTPMANLTVPLSLGDVMGIAAQKPLADDRQIR